MPDYIVVQAIGGFSAINPAPPKYCEIDPTQYNEVSNTYAQRVPISLISCSSDQGGDVLTCDEWRARRCQNDDCFSIPFTRGEILFLQFHMIVNPNNISAYGWDYGSGGVFKLEVYNADGTLFSDDMNTFTQNAGVGFDDTNTSSQWIEVLTADLPSEFSIALFYEYPGSGTGRLFGYSYREVSCDEMTIYFMSQYVQDDAMNIYRTPSIYTQNPIGAYYRAAIRVRGELVPIEIVTESTKVEEKQISAQRTKTYRLRCEKMPAEYADRLSRVLSGDNLQAIPDVGGSGGSTISLVIDEQFTVTKEFDEGLDWLVTCEFREKKNKVDFSCD